MILITGANGKLGSQLMAKLSQSSEVRGALRRSHGSQFVSNEYVVVGAFNKDTDWRIALSGCETVIHCAALTRIDPSKQADSEFQVVNADASRALALQASQAGVKRIVYISSLTVNRRHSGSQPIKSDDDPCPDSAYSLSKLAAELALREVEKATGIEVVVIRIPRIIWPELSGNLALFSRLIRRGVPLPFGNFDDNLRDNISGENLLDVILKAIYSKRAAGKTLLASDNDPLSTRQLAERCGDAIGRPPRLFSVPRVLVKAGMFILPGKFMGGFSRGELYQELTRNLVIDTRETQEVLEWAPSKKFGR